MPVPRWMDLDEEAHASAERTRHAAESLNSSQRARLVKWLAVGLIVAGAALVIAGVVVLELGQG